MRVKILEFIYFTIWKIDNKNFSYNFNYFLTRKKQIYLYFDFKAINLISIMAQTHVNYKVLR